MNGLEPVRPHWLSERDGDGILWLSFDKRDAAVNTLSADVIAGLDEALRDIEAAPPRGVVIRSAKSAGFIAGADIGELLHLDSHGEAVALIRRAQSVFDRLEALPCPTVALIHGYCLGGGLELALATRYRIAEDDPRTRLGLPEVRLGIHPGFGGTVRAPRLIGALPALDLMLSGRALDARAAARLGLVDYALPRRQLERAARETILHEPARHRPPLWQRLAAHRFARPQIARRLRRRVAAKAPEHHYPAPHALIDLWEHHADDPARMYAEEANSVARLVLGDTAKNLIRVFFLQEKLKAFGKTAAAPTVQRVHVVGAGAMGGDIAAWCVAQGLTVTLQDLSAEHIGAALARAQGLLRKRLREPRLVRAAMDRLIPDVHGAGVAHADVVIEAISENAAAKQALLRDIEPRLKADALLATNTSSIALETLVTALAAPQRLVGLHFFNPVAKMQLVEVVSTGRTDAALARRAAAFVRRIDRLPLAVRSRPGFLVNRVLMPYLLEAVMAVTEGIRPETVDRAAITFGMPVGPVELADAVGLDICLAVADNLAEHLDLPVPERLRRMVEAGQLGRKSGRGFYSYRNGEAVKTRDEADGSMPSDLGDRLILGMLNEAVACLREGIAANEDAIDAGIVFGAGFAPFRGGPLHYIRSVGAAQLRERLQALSRRHGARFEPDEGWLHLSSGEAQR